MTSRAALILMLLLLTGCATGARQDAAGLVATDEFLRRTLEAYQVGRPPDPLPPAPTPDVGV